MKIHFDKLSELLESGLDIGRIELPEKFQFSVKNPHLPIDKDNLVNPRDWEAMKEFDRLGINYTLRVEPHNSKVYLSISSNELRRIYSNH